MMIMRKIAATAAVILLLGQTIAATHYHPASSQREFSAGLESVAGSACAICAAQVHSPAAYATVPALYTPKLLLESVVLAVFIEPLSAYASYRFGRAPPLSL